MMSSYNQKFYIPSLPSGLDKIKSLKVLDVSYQPIENLDGLGSCKQLSEIILSSCDKLINVDGLNSCGKIKKIIMRSCYSLENVDGLANCVHLESLDLDTNKILQNVDGIANCDKLSYLNMSSCKMAKPKPSPVCMQTKESVEAYQKRIIRKMKK